jgi:hypothetical protein
VALVVATRSRTKPARASTVADDPGRGWVRATTRRRPAARARATHARTAAVAIPRPRKAGATW